MVGDVLARDDAGNGQPIGHASRDGVLLKKIACRAIAHDEDVKVEFRVLGHEVDQPVNRIPAPYEACETENQTRLQAEVCFGDLGIGDTAEALGIDAIRDDSDARRDNAIFGYGKGQYAGHRQDVVGPYTTGTRWAQRPSRCRRRPSWCARSSYNGELTSSSIGRP